MSCFVIDAAKMGVSRRAKIRRFTGDKINLIEYEENAAWATFDLATFDLATFDLAAFDLATFDRSVHFFAPKALSVAYIFFVQIT